MAFWAFEKIKAEQKEFDKINVCVPALSNFPHTLKEREKKKLNYASKNEKKNENSKWRFNGRNNRFFFFFREFKISSAVSTGLYEILGLL